MHPVTTGDSLHVHVYYQKHCNREKLPSVLGFSCTPGLASRIREFEYVKVDAL